MIRLGIVGSGHMGQQRARLFHEMAETQVVSAFAATLEEARPVCDLTGARPAEDFDALLREVDGVVVSVPNYLHARFALEALNEGKHVLVEYPMAVSSEEVEALRAAQRAAGTVLMAGNTIIHEAMFQYLMAHRERLGRLVSASSRVALYSDDIAGAWYMNPERSGPVFAAFHYHHIEYYRRFLGEVVQVMARDESLPDEAHPGHVTISGGTMVMAHEGGGTSSIQWYLSASGSGLPRGLWLNGTRASVTVLSMEKDRSRVVWDDGGEDKVEVCDDEWGVPGSCRDFIQAVQGKLDHRQRLESDLKTLRIGFAAAESSRRGEIVRLP